MLCLREDGFEITLKRLCSLTLGLSRVLFVMFAVVETGGKQYRVAKGVHVTLERLPAEVGESVVFDRVLLLGADKDTIVDPAVLEKARVSGKVLSQHRGEKLIVFKKRRRKHSRRKNGHRQYLTRVEITDISQG